MNALEALAAAIEKLERQRSRASDGTWRADPASRTNGTIALSNEVGRYVTHYTAEPDAELIVTLHGTINAQLAILDEGVRTVEREYGHAVTPASRRVVDLARTILGGAS